MSSRAQKYAWVSGGCGYGYTLHVSKDPLVEVYEHLDNTRILNFGAAQHLANAIRIYARKQELQSQRVRKLVKRHL